LPKVIFSEFRIADSPLEEDEAKAFVDRFIQRFDARRVDDIFSRHGGTKKKLLPSSLGPALRDVGVDLSPEEVAQVFKQADLDDDKGLDWAEFRMAVKTPTKLQQWTDTLPLSQLLAHSLSLRVQNSEDPVRGVAGMTPPQLEDTMDVLCRGLRRLLAESQAELAKCYEAMDRLAAAAEAADGGAGVKYQTFKMSTGTVEDFQEGLKGRVGECPSPRDTAFGCALLLGRDGICGHNHRRCAAS
jgi:hypothetical protein